MFEFETPTTANYNAETQKWDWEPGIFWKRDARRNRILTSSVCPEQLAKRTPEQECDDLLDIFVQAVIDDFLLNEYHFDTTLEQIRERVLELDPEKGEFKIKVLSELGGGGF